VIRSSVGFEDTEIAILRGGRGFLNFVEQKYSREECHSILLHRMSSLGRLPEKPREVDVIIASNFFEECPDTSLLAHALSQCSRILKPHGYFLAYFPNFSDRMREVYSLIGSERSQVYSHQPFAIKNDQIFEALYDYFDLEYVNFLYAIPDEIARKISPGNIYNLSYNIFLIARKRGTLSWRRNLLVDFYKDATVFNVPNSQNVTPYLRLEKFNIKGEERTVIFSHTPSSISFNVALPPRAALDFGIALHPETWGKLEGQGVMFRIIVKGEGQDEGRNVFSKYINPYVLEEDRKWFDYNVSLEGVDGGRAAITFETLSGTDGRGGDYLGWAGWSEPKIIERK
jgi:hypothetical protein